MNKLANYTVATFEVNDESREFFKWFKTSSYTNQFDVAVSQDNGADVFEVIQYNPFLNIDALEEIFLVETGENTEDCPGCEHCQGKEILN